MPRLRYIYVLIFLVCATALPSRPQAVNATLLGTISDASGAVVPDAKITVTETQTGVNRNLQSNESGYYALPNLPPGIYAVAVEAPGFKKETRKKINVLVDTSTRVDFQLQPGNVSESIEVTGAPALLQTDSASTSEKLQAK